MKVFDIMIFTLERQLIATVLGSARNCDSIEKRSFWTLLLSRRFQRVRRDPVYIGCGGSRRQPGSTLCRLQVRGLEFILGLCHIRPRDRLRLRGEAVSQLVGLKAKGVTETLPAITRGVRASSRGVRGHGKRVGLPPGMCQLPLTPTRSTPDLWCHVTSLVPSLVSAVGARPNPS